MEESTSIAYFAVLIVLLVGYLLGSIPFGLVFTRLFRLGDVRQVGSGNIGATNVLRMGNKKVAALTLLGDLLKGYVAVTLAMMVADGYLDYMWLAPLTGVSAFLGHLFPVWLQFKGGKGVATFIGVILALYWPSTVIFVVVWLAVFCFTRYSSLAAIVSVIVTPFVILCLGHGELFIWVAIMALIIIVKHKSNILRLWRGTENKIGKH